MKPLLISIEGNIGVGKTTILNKLKKKFKNASFLEEDVAEWINIYDKNNDNILNRFYSDMKRNGFMFENFVYINRYMKLFDEIKKGNEYIFMDRSMNTDMFIFAKIHYEEKNISEIEWKIYNEWYKMINIYLNNFSQKTIYLFCSPEVALERIKKRGRKEEQNITLEYITKLHNYHNKLMETINDKIIIDYNKDLTENETDEFIEKLFLSIEKILYI